MNTISEKSKAAQILGRLGGNKVVEKYGVGYFKEIASRPRPGRKPHNKPKEKVV